MGDTPVLTSPNTWQKRSAWVSMRLNREGNRTAGDRITRREGTPVKVTVRRYRNRWN